MEISWRINPTQVLVIMRYSNQLYDGSHEVQKESYQDELLVKKKKLFFLQFKADIFIYILIYYKTVLCPHLSNAFKQMCHSN